MTSLVTCVTCVMTSAAVFWFRDILTTAVLLTVFTARRHASAVCAMSLYPSVGTSVTNRRSVKTAKRSITDTKPLDSLGLRGFLTLKILTKFPTESHRRERQYTLIGRTCELARYISNKSSSVAEIGDRLATIDMGRKVGELRPPFFGGSPSNTMWAGPRPTSVPSGILIHPAAWPP